MDLGFNLAIKVYWKVVWVLERVSKQFLITLVILDLPEQDSPTITKP